MPYGKGPLAAALERDDEPVVVTGGALPLLLGQSVDQIGIFRYDPESGGFVPIPFQVDERIEKVFNPGLPLEFVENIYDVRGEEDGLLDGDDEIAFLFGDGGDRAPEDAAWPPGAAPTRFELSVTDPRSEAPVRRRWLYLFTGPALPRSTERHVEWEGGPATSIETATFALDYEDKWLLTGLRLFPPCGGGSDLIDRVKGRAQPQPGILEDEEGWNFNSFFYGGKVGPIRAIRYVRGATSGVNTLHHDVVYGRLWIRQVNLRVHPVLDVSLYLDWLPRTGARFYSPEVREGVDVDGAPDDVPATFVNWTLTSSSEGGLALLLAVPNSPLYEEKRFVYRDDLDHDDRIPFNENYGDDDDAAIGVMGIKLFDLGDSNIDPISLRWRAHPLCSDVGDGSLGEAFYQLKEEPLAVAVSSQTPEGTAIRSLQLARHGADLHLHWDETPGEPLYRVYGATTPGQPRESWEVLGETPETTWTDRGAAEDPAPAFYSVVEVRDGGEGPW
jgi:hypothetical protein